MPSVFWDEFNSKPCQLYNLKDVSIQDLTVSSFVKDHCFGKQEECKNTKGKQPHNTVLMMCDLEYMETRLLLNMLCETKYNAILMWHLYTFHGFDKVLTFGNNEVQFFNI